MGSTFSIALGRDPTTVFCDAFTRRLTTTTNKFAQPGSTQSARNILNWISLLVWQDESHRTNESPATTGQASLASLFPKLLPTRSRPTHLCQPLNVPQQPSDSKRQQTALQPQSPYKQWPKLFLPSRAILFILITTDSAILTTLPQGFTR